MTRFSLGAMDSLDDHVLRPVGRPRRTVAREGGSGAMRHMSSAAPCGDARRGLMKLANNNPTSMRSVVGQSRGGRGDGGQFLHSLRAYHSASCHCEQDDLSLLVSSISDTRIPPAFQVTPFPALS